MYYECHVTIDPVWGEDLRKVTEIANHSEFRVAKFIMQKDQGIEDTFMTLHDARLEHVTEMLNKLLHELQDIVKVRRYKIEKIIFDSKLHGIF